MVSVSFSSFKTLLGLPLSSPQPNTPHCRNISCSEEGLHFIAGECQEEPANKVVSSSSSSSSSSGCMNKSGLLGFGLTSCSCTTESLGFESSDQMDEEEEKEMLSRCAARASTTTTTTRRRVGTREGVTSFPPPLTSLYQNGHPSFYLKPERKDGRLTLTRVKINRPEILRSSRQDGRLTLYLIKPDPEPELEPELEKTEEEVEETSQKQQSETEEQDVMENSESEYEVSEDDDISESETQWKLPITGNNGESYRRCHIMNHHYHYHHHHQHPISLWSRDNCVTTG